MGQIFVEQPQLTGNFPILAVNATAPLAVTASSTTPILYQNVQVDSLGAYVGVSGAYAPRVAGWYAVTIAITMQSVAPTAVGPYVTTLSLFKNGTSTGNQVVDAHVYQVAGTNAFALSVQALVQFNATTDFIQTVVNCNATGTLTVLAGSTFTAQYLHP
jgi:hypothetical protein